jgi:hypothetical protein
VEPGHYKELSKNYKHKENFSRKINTTKKWCSGKQRSLVPIGLQLEPQQWQSVFATFRDLAFSDLAKMPELWDLRKFYDDLEHFIFKRNPYMWDPTEFYDDLERSVFKNNAYMWGQCWSVTFL